MILTVHNAFQLFTFETFYTAHILFICLTGQVYSSIQAELSKLDSALDLLT